MERKGRSGVLSMDPTDVSSGGRQPVAPPAPCDYAAAMSIGILATVFVLVLLVRMPQAEPIMGSTIVWRYVRNQPLQPEPKRAEHLTGEHLAARHQAGEPAEALEGDPQSQRQVAQAGPTESKPSSPSRSTSAGKHAAADSGLIDQESRHSDAQHSQRSSDEASAPDANGGSVGAIANGVAGQQPIDSNKDSNSDSGGNSDSLQQRKNGSHADKGQAISSGPPGNTASNSTRSPGASSRSSHRQGPGKPRSSQPAHKHTGGSASKHGGMPGSAQKHRPAGGLKKTSKRAGAAAAPAQAGAGAASESPSGPGSPVAPGQTAAAEVGPPPGVAPAAELAPEKLQHTGRKVDWASCLSEDDSEMPATVDDYLHPRPARVRVEAVYNSRQPRGPAAVTMFVTASANRLDYLDAMCSSWGSVVALAYYVAVPANATDPAQVVRDGISVIHRKFEQLEAAGGCQLDVMVVSERVDATAAMLFPINVLRNLALLMAQTELVLHGDMDLLIGTDLRDIVTGDNGTSTAKYQQLLDMTANRRLVVVPTFQTWVLKWAVEAAEGGKAAAARLWDGDNFRYFLQGGYEPAHRDTDVARWVNATEAYELSDTNRDYEPWWIARRADIAPYDVRYRGYGKDKVQHLQELLADLGFRYVVHPRAFMVHRPHEESAAKQRVDAEYAERRKREAAGEAATALPAEEQQHFSIAGMSQRWLNAQHETPPPHKLLVCAGWRRCRDSLPFWDVYGSAGEPMPTVTSLDGGSQIDKAHRRQLHSTYSSSGMFRKRVWQR